MQARRQRRERRAWTLTEGYTLWLPEGYYSDRNSLYHSLYQKAVILRLPAVASTVQIPLTPTLQSFSTSSIPGGTRYTGTIYTTGSDGSHRTDTITRDVVGNTRTTTISTVSFNPNAHPPNGSSTVKVVATVGTVGSDGKMPVSLVTTLNNGTPQNYSARVAPASAGDSGLTNQQALYQAFVVNGLSN